MKQYRGAWNIISRYFAAYGGWRSVLFSPYLQISAVISITCLDIWSSGTRWKELILQVLPNLLGFSIGSFAILFSAFQGKIGPYMFQKDDGDEFSPAEELSATFMHFILVQTLALLIGIVGYSGLGSAIFKILVRFGYSNLASMPLHLMYQCYKFFGFMLFIYSIMILISATAAIFRTITWEVMANNK